MKKIILAIVCLISFASYSQDLSHWEGHYSGSLTSETIHANASFRMELIIEAIDDSSFNWIIIYGEDSTRQERKYILNRTTYESHFELDEQNSIVLDFDLIHNSFYSVFEVDGNLIHVEYQWHKDEIIFILTSSNGKVESGNTTHDGEEIPLVTSYTTGTVQYAVLKKSN